MLMLDLCAGLGGASQAMRDRGWDVITLDNDPRFECDITADLRDWTWHDPTPDLIWLSDPCAELARSIEGKHEHAPGLELIQIGGIVANMLARYDWLDVNSAVSDRYSL